MRASLLSLLVAVIAAFPIPSQAQFANAKVVDYPSDGVVLGNGWSSLAAGKTAGACLQFDEKQDLSEDRWLNLRRVVDREQLNRTLEVSVEFQAKAALGVGGSAKSTYTKSVELKSEGLNLAILAKVLQGATFVVPKPGTPGVQLTDQAAGLARDKMADFLALCGDSFVAAIHSGGEINALLQFNVNSSDERESINASVIASGLSFSGSASVNQTMKKYRESQQLSMNMYAAGGTGVPIAVDEATLLARLTALPSDAKSAPKPYRISLIRYDSLPNWPSSASLAASKFAQMEQLVSQYQRYTSLYFDANAVLLSPGAYVFRGAYNEGSIRQLSDELRVNRLPALRKRLVDCLAAKDCSMPKEGLAEDYEFRARMPVRVGSFAEDSQLTTLAQQLTNARNAYQQAPDNITLNLPLVKGATIPNPAKPQLKNAVTAAENAWNAANQQFPAAYANAVYTQWIKIPSFYRCAEDPVANACLSQAQLSAYLKSIQAEAAK